jgi:hypothetical protein
VLFQQTGHYLSLKPHTIKQLPKKVNNAENADAVLWDLIISLSLFIIVLSTFHITTHNALSLVFFEHSFPLNLP